MTSRAMEYSIQLCYDNPDFSDVTVRWSGREIKAHRVILCCQSEYFKRALGPRSQSKESQDGVIELWDDDPDAVEAMLRRLYTRERDVEEPWQAQLALAIVADKYTVPALEELAASRLGDKIHHPPSHCLLEVMSALLKYSDSNGYLAGDVVRAMGRDFPIMYCFPVVQTWLDRNPHAAGELMGKHFHTLLKNPEFVTKLREDPSMSLNILDQLNGKLGGKKFQIEGNGRSKAVVRGEKVPC